MGSGAMPLLCIRFCFLHFRMLKGLLSLVLSNGFFFLFNPCAICSGGGSRSCVVRDRGGRGGGGGGSSHQDHPNPFLCLPIFRKWGKTSRTYYLPSCPLFENTGCYCFFPYPFLFKSIYHVMLNAVGLIYRKDISWYFVRYIFIVFLPAWICRMRTFCRQFAF